MEVWGVTKPIVIDHCSGLAVEVAALLALHLLVLAPWCWEQDGLFN